MDSAQRVLIVYGLGSALYSFILGIALARVRMRAPVAPRHLVTVHISGLIQAGLHLGLAAALAAASYTNGTATVGAALLVAGSGLELAGGTANWLQKVDDQFASRSLGYRLNALSGPTSIIGLVLVTLCVVSDV